MGEITADGGGGGGAADIVTLLQAFIDGGVTPFDAAVYALQTYSHAAADIFKDIPVG